MIDGNSSGPFPGQPGPNPSRPANARGPRIPHLVAAAIPCAIALVLGLAGVGTPTRSGDVRGIAPLSAAPRDSEEQRGMVPLVDRLALAELADGRAPVAFGDDIARPEFDAPDGSAALDPKVQKAVDKLLAKIVKQEVAIASQEDQIAAFELQLALAEQALLDALAMPENTPAEIKAKQKALKKANAALLKWQKKIAKAEAKIDVASGKIAAYEAQIEAIAPGYLNGSSGEEDEGEGEGEGEGEDETPGDGPPPDSTGNGDEGNTTPSGGSVSVPLYVQEVLPKGQTGFQRTGAIATFGIPFAQSDQVGLVNGRPALAVTNSSTYQFRTLALWPSGHVKWAQVDLAADVPAGGINTSHAIVNGQGRSGPDDLAFDDGKLITVETGNLVLQVNKQHFNVFHRVWAGNKEIVSQGQGVGIIGVSVEYDSLIVAKPGSVIVNIEENGPARAIVRADGTLTTLKGQDLVDFTCRIIARAGSNDVQVDFTVRNANITRPHHVVIDSLGIATRINDGANPMVTLSKHANGTMTSPLGQSDWTYLHQAQSGAFTYNTVKTMLDQQGYQIVKNGTPLQSLGDKAKFPKHGFVDLTGAHGGVTMAYQHMPYKSPASLEVYGNGLVLAGLFSARHSPGRFWTYSWRQHESRTVAFSFHAGKTGDPAKVAASLDLPVVGRAADYLHYDRAGVLPYRLVSLAQENQAFASMGLNYSVSVTNPPMKVTRWLYSHETGGDNNYDSIERQLGGDWLRQGHGGSYLSALDLAMYKSEWQILRSDNFLDKNDPGPVNPELPHESGYEGDYEHRYRDGIILAYWLTGDARFRDALFDDAEILNHLYFYEQERCIAQSLRAIARVGEFTGDPGGLLRTELKAWLQTFCSKIVNINVPDPFLIGWGWEAAPGQGSRRYFATNVGSNVPPVNGNYYQSRGFFAASLAPLGMYHASRWLGLSDPQGALARARMRDLAFFTREELYPYKSNPASRYLVYTYGLNKKSYDEMEQTDFHPIWLGLGEAFKDTGDIKYMQRAIEAFEGFAAHDNGEYANNLNTVENRLDVQHFLRGYLDWLAATGQN